MWVNGTEEKRAAGGDRPGYYADWEVAGDLLRTV